MIRKEEWGRAPGSLSMLAGLLDTETEELGEWSSTDLGALLGHQLRTPLRLEAERLIPHAGTRRAEAAALLESGPYSTFYDVLARGSSDDEGLAMVKGFAKESLSRAEALPRPIAHFLYVCAVLRARALGDQTISALDDTALKSEARRCLTLPWLTTDARRLLRVGLGD